MSTQSTRRVLVLFAHPALQKSRIHRPLLRALRGLEAVTVHDLYEAYPDFDVDVAREQRLLSEHDAIVLQHPMYWYSTPPLVKQWEDLVLEHGWAYGTGGTALSGKTLLCAVSTGGSESSYAPDGANRHTVADLLKPIELTARLCGLEWLPPFVVHGTHALGAPEIAGAARDYRRLVEALRDGSLDLAGARALARINADLDRVLRG